MSPEAAVSALDQQLAKHGEDTLLRRPIGTQQAFVDVTVRAFVRNYAPGELEGGIIQGDRMITISPTQINAAQWPGATVIPAGAAKDKRVPVKNDVVVIEGVRTAVQAAAPIYIGSHLVRIDIQVRG